MADEKLTIVINGKDQTKAAFSGVTASLKNLQAVAGKLMLAIGGLLAIKKLTQAMADNVRMANEEEASWNRLGASINATGAEFGSVRGEIEKYLEAQKRRVAMDDGDGREAISRLTQATGDYTTAMKLMPVALDLAAGKQMDLTLSAELVGKVAQGNTAILTRYGIALGENATATEALAELQKRFAGQAEAYGNTTAGALQKLKITWNNLREDVGMTAQPLIRDVANAITGVVEKIGPAIVAMFEGLFGTLRGLGSVFMGFVRGVASAMGIDLDALADDSKTWGENIVIQLANGIASATLWVVRALNTVGDVIAEWLAPGSPPKLLPEIDAWGRDAILEYLGGAEQVTEADARQALDGIRRYYDDLLNPINFRLREIGNERQDITDTHNIGLLEKRLQEGFTNPEAKRMVELRLEELKLQMQARDLELERDQAMTAAERKLADSIKENAALTEKIEKLKEAKDAVSAYAGENYGASEAVNTLGASTSALAERIAGIFAPVSEEATKLGNTFGGVVKTIKDHLKALFGEDEPMSWQVASTRTTAPMGRFAQYARLAVEAWTGAKELLGGAIDGIAGWFAAFWTNHNDEVYGLADSAIDAGIKWGQAAVDIGAAIKSIGESLNELSGGEGPLISLDRTIEMTLVSLQDLGTMIGGVAETVAGLAGTVAGLVKVMKIMVTNGSLTDLDAAMTETADAMMRAVMGIPNALKAIWDNETLRNLNKYPELADPNRPSRFASGGDFITRGPQLIMVGEAGPERVQVTPVNNYNLNVTTQQQSMGIMADFATMQLMGA